MDLSTDTKGRYQSDDPDGLRDRLVRLVQVETTEFVHTRTLAEMLVAGPELTGRLQAYLEAAPQPGALGLQMESLVILSVKAAPSRSFMSHQRKVAWW